MVTQEAAKFPDMDRGLDQLLAKLPTQALQPPKLQAEPSAINLGQVKIGQDRTQVGDAVVRIAIGHAAHDRLIARRRGVGGRFLGEQLQQLLLLRRVAKVGRSRPSACRATSRAASHGEPGSARAWAASISSR